MKNWKGLTWNYSRDDDEFITETIKCYTESEETRREPQVMVTNTIFTEEFDIKNSCKISCCPSSTLRNSKWYFNFFIGFFFLTEKIHTRLGDEENLTCFWGYWKWKFFLLVSTESLFLVTKHFSTRFTMPLIFMCVLVMPQRDKQVTKILWKLKAKRLRACMSPYFVLLSLGCVLCENLIWMSNG